MRRYTIGIDFGTLSGRVLLVDTMTGEEIICKEKAYSHGVIDQKLPECDIVLDKDWALQDPRDYLEVLREIVPAAVKESGVDPNQIIGIGVDCTTSTMMPVDVSGQPLCMKEEWYQNPHAWIKLWKHHAAQPLADRMTELALQRNESWIGRYGNKISSEWTLPKIWQILEEAPEVYDEAYTFIEVSDWIVMQMTGNWVKSAGALGYKALWNPVDGFPSQEYLQQLHPRLENLIKEKLIKDSIEIKALGTPAGVVTKEAAQMLGVPAGIPVAVSLIDAHVTMPAAQITDAGRMLMIMGTSTCNILLGKEEWKVPGICGVVQDGVVEGLYAYEAGQSGVGDIFGWFVENCVPESYYQEAHESGMNIHQLLENKAAKQKIGQHGLMALDWMNGNRSILVDAELSGMILGLTLQTKPEDIYRALIEATAFGQKIIFDTFAQMNVSIDQVYAAGGLPEKNRMMMQIYADVLDLEIRICGSKQAPALGSAIYAAKAAGAAAGGYETLQEAASAMGSIKEESYKPIVANVAQYKVLYQEYRKLHDYYGCGVNDIMKTLRRIRNNQQ